jgi:hypothetical protein
MFSRYLHQGVGPHFHPLISRRDLTLKNTTQVGEGGTRGNEREHKRNNQEEKSLLSSDLIVVVVVEKVEEDSEDSNSQSSYVQPGTQQKTNIVHRLVVKLFYPLQPSSMSRSR